MLQVVSIFGSFHVKITIAVKISTPLLMSEIEEDSRRKSKRYKVSWPTRILFPSKKIMPARTKDVSSGGVGFEYKDKLPVGQELSLEFSPWLNGKQYVIRAKGVVTYTMIMSGSNGFSHGFKFTMIPKEQFEALSEILRFLEQK